MPKIKTPKPKISKPKNPKISTTGIKAPKYKPLKVNKGYVKKDGTFVSPHIKGGKWS